MESSSGQSRQPSKWGHVGNRCVPSETDPTRRAVFRLHRWGQLGGSQPKQIVTSPIERQAFSQAPFDSAFHLAHPISDCCVTVPVLSLPGCRPELSWIPMFSSPRCSVLPESIGRWCGEGQNARHSVGPEGVLCIDHQSNNGLTSSCISGRMASSSEQSRQPLKGGMPETGASQRRLIQDARAAF